MGLIRILSIDGGGIRGIIPGEVLVRLETLIKLYSGNQDARIADYFDMICGTSTGAILAALYLYPDEKNPLRPKYLAEDAVQLYKENGTKIFTTTFWQRLTSIYGLIGTKYSATYLEKVLKDYLGDVRLSQLLKPCLIPCYDLENSRTMFFNQLDPTKSEKEDFLIRDILRGATAVPSFFSPYKLETKTGVVYSLIDGGVFANNPTLCGFAEATKLSGEVRVDQTFILSVGTGGNKLEYPYSKVKSWGRLPWITPIIEIMGEGQSETVDFQLKRMFSAIKHSDNYIRIQANLTKYQEEKLAFDDASSENVELLSKIGKHVADKYDAELRRVARKIVG